MARAFGTKGSKPAERTNEQTVVQITAYSRGVRFEPESALSQSEYSSPDNVFFDFMEICNSLRRYSEHWSKVDLIWGRSNHLALRLSAESIIPQSILS